MTPPRKALPPQERLHTAIERPFMKTHPNLSDQTAQALRMELALADAILGGDQ